MSIGRIAMAALYVAAAIGHILATRLYETIMPDYLPAHRLLVLLSGVAEMAGGIGLLMPSLRLRRLAAGGIILLLIAVFPANLWMVQHPDRYPGVPLWALWLRLPLQVLLVAWAARYTRPESKPATAA